jgi:hypothetical protein
MLKIQTLKRWREERQQLRLALLVAINALGKAKVHMDGGHAKVLGQGFNLVRQEGDPTLGFEEHSQSPASRIMSLDQARASGMIRGR